LNQKLKKMMKKILLVLPTYNEEKIVEKNALKVFEFCQNNLKNYAWQILIADNGSTDKTVQIAHQLNKNFPKISYFHSKIPGRGRALKKAWTKYEADIYIYMDIDLATDLNYLPLLIKAIEEENFDLAIGSRLKKEARIQRSFFREISSRIYNLILKFFFPGYPIKDSQCGFKAISGKIKKEILPKVKNESWFFDTELLILSWKNGYKIKEIAVNWQEERFSKRKSKVKFFQTVLADLIEILKLKKRLKKETF